MMFRIQRYSVQEEVLLPYVRHFWHFKMDQADIHSKLLPTDHIDVLINLAGSMIYETDGRRQEASSCHINGLRSRYHYIHQYGDVNIYGITFYAYGLYPFIRSPLDIKDRIVSLDLLCADLARKLHGAVSAGNTYEAVNNLEQVLLSELIASPEDMQKMELINIFLREAERMPVQEFCRNNNLNVKTFERITIKYTGYTPGILQRIRRFQSISNQLVHEQPGLTDLAYKNAFADQSHLIKEFRRFSGRAPGKFQKEKVSVKENISYDYL